MIPLLSGKIVSRGCTSEKGKLTIVHAGSIHGKRSLKELCLAITILKAKYLNLEDLVEICLYGRCADQEIARVKHSGNEDIILFKGYKSIDEMSEIHDSADALLLIDPVIEGNYCFPSKLCDYAQYNKPIICIANSDSPSYLLLKQYNYPAFSIGQEDLLASYIDGLLSGHCNHIYNQKDLAHLFTKEYVGDKYMSIVFRD